MESDQAVIAQLESLIAKAASSYAPSARYLAIIRIVFGLWMILFPVDLRWMTAVPTEFFHPRPGLFFFLATTPPDSFLVALEAARIALGAVLIVGLWTVPVSILLSLVLIISSGVSYSFSKVDHFILFEITPIFLAIAGWGFRWSLDAAISRRRSSGKPRIARGMPVLLFAMTIGWAMLSAAVPKIVGGWLDPNREATRGYLARDILRDEKLGPLGPSLLQVDSSVIWKIVDYSTLIAEGGLILVVLFPTVYRLWLVLLIGFHIGVYLGLGISFVDYAMVYAVFFSPFVVWLAAGVRGRSFTSPTWLPTRASRGPT